MARKILIDPPRLMCWLPEDMQTGVIFLELEPDFPTGETFRLDLNVIFRPVAIRRGFVQKQDFYVGSTGARIEVRIKDGKITTYTKKKSIKVGYEETDTHSRKAEVSISPKIEVGKDISLEPGEVTFGKDVARSHTNKYSGTEQTLAVAAASKYILWELADTPNKVIREYQLRNLYLFLEASTKKEVEGKIIVRPSDIRYFGPDHKKLSWTKSFFMDCSMSIGGKNIDENDIELEYREVK